MARRMETEDIIRGLEAAAEWIPEMVGCDFEKHHKFMCDAIDGAVELLKPMVDVKGIDAAIERLSKLPKGGDQDELQG